MTKSASIRPELAGGDAGTIHDAIVDVHQLCRLDRRAEGDPQVQVAQGAVGTLELSVVGVRDDAGLGAAGAAVQVDDVGLPDADQHHSARGEDVLPSRSKFGFPVRLP